MPIKPDETSLNDYISKASRIVGVAAPVQSDKHSTLSQPIASSRTVSNGASSVASSVAESAALAIARAQAMEEAKKVSAMILQKATVAGATSSSSSGTGAAAVPALSQADKEAEQKRLEEEMRKRRERIEKWRMEKKGKDNKDTKEQAQPSKPAPSEDSVILISACSARSYCCLFKIRTWNLEDDDDDDPEDDNKASRLSNGPGSVPPESKQRNIKHSQIDSAAAQPSKPRVVDEDIDPLEAYMKELSKDKTLDRTKEPPKPLVTKSEEPAAPKRVAICSGVAKVKKVKGDIMEQNEDALEYDTDEDNADSGLDFLEGGIPKIKTKGVSDFSLR